MLEQEAARCGELGWRATKEEIAAARACVLAAHRERRPFVLRYQVRGIDSILRGAIAGRDDGDRLEVRWFWYDSCPSGCGDADPHWWSLRCRSLVDVAAACKKVERLPARERAKVDEELRFICGRDEESPPTPWSARDRFGLWCEQADDQRDCGAPLELGRVPGAGEIR